MSPAVLEVVDGELAFGDRIVWSGVDLAVEAGEFVTVLGPNGSGKTSLLRAVLGQVALSRGRIEVLGHPPRRGSRSVGYVPQQRIVDPSTPVRARDLVRLGVDGDRWGPGRHSRRAQVDELLAAVGATEYADVPVGMLSGGEQQRVRIAQALASGPAVLLCDEPLLSLDIRRQHEVNPVLPYTDRVLYLAPAGHAIGAPDEVLTSARLTALYGTPIDVLRAQGRVLIVGDDGHVHHVEEGDQ